MKILVDANDVFDILEGFDLFDTREELDVNRISFEISPTAKLFYAVYGEELLMEQVRRGYAKLGFEEGARLFEIVLQRAKKKGILKRIKVAKVEIEG